MIERSKQQGLSLAKLLLLCCGLAGLFAAAEARADANDMAALLEDRACYACHALTETLIGPSYQAIAELHRSRKEVMVEVLARKIIVGGAGTWGLVPMVPNEHVSEEEARAMAEWILKQAPSK